MNPPPARQAMADQPSNFSNRDVVADVDEWLWTNAGIEKIRQIGKGSFGFAYLVRLATNPKRLYVLKTVDISNLTAGEQRTALNEVRIFSQLDHPFIIRYRGSFLTPDLQLCILMDFAAGGDLCRLIGAARKNHRRFSERQLTLWFAQSTLALRYLHSRHILHRDVKSQNLFLTRRGTICLGDFGIAKSLAATSALTATQIGTPYFYSPELCAGRPYSWAADIWALGCLFYEATALSVPFVAENISILVERISKCRPPPLPACYSAEFRNLISSCLQRESSLRPSADELLRKPILRAALDQMLAEKQATLLLRQPPPATPDHKSCSSSQDSQQQRGSGSCTTQPSSASEAASPLAPAATQPCSHNPPPAPNDAPHTPRVNGRFELARRSNTTAPNGDLDSPPGKDTD